MWLNRLCTVKGYRPRLNWRLKWSPDSVHQPCLREESSAYLKQGIFPKLTPRYHPGWQPLWLSVKIPCSPLAKNKVNGQIWPKESNSPWNLLQGWKDGESWLALVTLVTQSYELLIQEPPKLPHPCSFLAFPSCPPVDLVLRENRCSLGE